MTSPLITVAEYLRAHGVEPQPHPDPESSPSDPDFDTYFDTFFVRMWLEHTAQYEPTMTIDILAPTEE